MKGRERLGRIDRRTVAAALLVLLVSGALVGVVAVAVDAFVFNTDTGQGETPHARFQFDQHDATLPATGESERTIVEISRESGTGLDQGNVTVQVNGESAWDVRTDDNDTAVLVEPWASAGEPLDGTGVRIVAYGDGEAGDPYLNTTAEEDEEPSAGENASDGETGDRETDEGASDDRTTEYEPLEEGDVVEIVWRDDESDEMRVLQRHVVEAPPEEEAETPEGEDGISENESDAEGARLLAVLTPAPGPQGPL